MMPERRIRSRAIACSAGTKNRSSTFMPGGWRLQAVAWSDSPASQHFYGWMLLDTYLTSLTGSSLNSDLYTSLISNIYLCRLHFCRSLGYAAALLHEISALISLRLLMASTGFYHDLDTGLYYSSRNGRYYIFENGTYVPITCTKEEKSVSLQCSSSVSGQPLEVDSFIPQHFPSDGTKNEQPPSQWIEETLIDFYLSGYTNLAVSPDKLSVPETNEHGCQFFCEGLTEHLASDDMPLCQSGCENQQNDERTLDFVHDMDVLADIVTSKEEENWKAQYGQVIQEAEEDFPPFSVVDLWDWEMIVGIAKNNHHVSRLIGKFARSSSKLHSSVPARGFLLKTAAIRDVHLDLVHVASEKQFSRDRAAERRALHGGFGRRPGQKS